VKDYFHRSVQEVSNFLGGVVTSATKAQLSSSTECSMATSLKCGSLFHVANQSYRQIFQSGVKTGEKCNVDEKRIRNGDLKKRHETEA